MVTEASPALRFGESGSGSSDELTDLLQDPRQIAGGVGPDAVGREVAWKGVREAVAVADEFGPWFDPSVDSCSSSVLIGQGCLL